MIKFFRKIRQNFLLEGKTGKYFKYALGEIILVVIGILIALQINNWNEDRKASFEEIVVLKAMKTDFLETERRAKETIESQNEVVDYCYKLQIMMNGQKDTDSIGEYIYRGALSYWRIEPANGTYDGLIGSGKTYIIKNQTLKSLLAEYSAEIKYGFEDEDFGLELTSILVEKSSPYSAFLEPERYRVRVGIEKPISKEKRNSSIAEHLNNNSFLGVLVAKSDMAHNRLVYQKNILSLVEKILTQIESELENKK
ncbi:DUF6090 family protein [uncultured Maribacter sp.]|uniref:DUF6090 family protein n=1 Tax=uncultured Maribacter sp. TaxID=431308 RepID=UPI0030DDAE2B|tara:strand:+ start:11649 stop:12410 length:762 start_codon:yes stop_codon:yes gene_type:complete